MSPHQTVISLEDRRMINDMRISVERPFLRDWNLHIRNVSITDAGEFMCQLNTDPVKSKQVNLLVNGQSFHSDKDLLCPSTCRLHAHTYIRTLARIHMYCLSHTHAHMHTHAHTRRHARTHAHTHTYTHTHTHTFRERD